MVRNYQPDNTFSRLDNRVNKHRTIQTKEKQTRWGTHVYLWRIHVDIWQNQYNIVKLKNKIKLNKIKKKEKNPEIFKK